MRIGFLPPTPMPPTCTSRVFLLSARYIASLYRISYPQTTSPHIEKSEQTQTGPIPSNTGYRSGPFIEPEREYRPSEYREIAFPERYRMQSFRTYGFSALKRKIEPPCASVSLGRFSLQYDRISVYCLVISHIVPANNVSPYRKIRANPNRPNTKQYRIPFRSVYRARERVPPSEYREIAFPKRYRMQSFRTYGFSATKAVAQAYMGAEKINPTKAKKLRIKITPKKEA